MADVATSFPHAKAFVLERGQNALNTEMAEWIYYTLYDNKQTQQKTRRCKPKKITKIYSLGIARNPLWVP